MSVNHVTLNLHTTPKYNTGDFVWDTNAAVTKGRLGYIVSPYLERHYSLLSNALAPRTLVYTQRFENYASRRIHTYVE